MAFYRFVTRDFFAKRLLFFFANDIICYGDEHHNARIHLCQRSRQHPFFLETVLRLGINIPCQGIYYDTVYLNNHNITEFPFLLRSENITLA